MSCHVTKLHDYVIIICLTLRYELKCMYRSMIIIEIAIGEKTSKTLAGDGGEKPVNLSIKNL